MQKALRQIGVLTVVSVGMWLLLGLLLTGPARGVIPEAVWRWSWIGGAVFTCFAGSAMALWFGATTWAKRQPVGAMLISMGLRTGIPLSVALLIGVLATFADVLPKPEMRIFWIAFIPAYVPMFVLEVGYTYRNHREERPAVRRESGQEFAVAERERGGDSGDNERER